MAEEKGRTRRNKYDRQPKRKAEEEFDRKWNEAAAAAAEVKYVQHKSLLGSEEGPATPRARCRSSGRPNRWWMLSVEILFLCMYWKYDSRKNIRGNINRTSIATREGEGELPSVDGVNLTSITQNIRPIKNTDIISTEVTLCKPLTSSVSFKLPEELQVYERFMIRKEQQMLDDRESMLKDLEDRNDHLNL